MFFLVSFPVFNISDLTFRFCFNLLFNVRYTFLWSQCILSSDPLMVSNLRFSIHNFVHNLFFSMPRIFTETDESFRFEF